MVNAIAKDEQLISAFEEHERTAVVADALLKTMRSLDRIKFSDRDVPTIDAYRRTAALIQGEHPHAPTLLSVANLAVEITLYGT